jgi:hypothetical protein
VVPTAFEVDNLLGPQGPQEGNLLLGAPSPIVKVLAQGFVFHMVPADAYSQPQAASTKDIYLRSLLGDQSGLPLPQDENRGD